MAADLRSADIVQMLASFNGAPGLQFPVHIKEIAQRADPITQTFTVRVRMKAPSGVNLLPGMTGIVTLTYRRASILGGQILVPITAIVKENTAGEVAWVIGPDGNVERRPVKTGSVTGDSMVYVIWAISLRVTGYEPWRRVRPKQSGRFFPHVSDPRGGIWSYQNIGRLEDPEFTIKEALVITPYPGASAQEVANEITNPIEGACQQLGQLKRVESESARGRSVVSVIIQDRYHRDSIPQVWDELRHKIADVQSRLPPSVRGRSIVVDDFGDVYGIFLTITGEGFTYPELRRYSEFLRRELQTVSDVKKVDLFAEQQETVFLEISRQRLAQLGINEDQIYAQLQAKNVVADGGRVRIGAEYPALDPTGGFRSAEEMLDLAIGSDRTGRQLLLRDVATLERGDEEPPRRLLKFDGKTAIGLGISTVQGGNVVTVGNGVQQKLEDLKRDQPIGKRSGSSGRMARAVCVRQDWREPEKVVRPHLIEQPALRNGITRVEVAQALETGFEGRTVGFYREPGDVGKGIYPQETRLLPIVARPPLAERSNVDALHSLQIWSPVAGRMIPLSQVAAGAEVAWEDPVVMRRDRFPTITVHADPRIGLPSQLFNRVRPAIEKIKLPPGYSLNWGGEYEDSRDARAALAKPLPLAVVLMVLIVVWIFNSARATLVICLTVPLAIVGVTAGLLLTAQPFGFMALLGAIALAGEQIKNSIVLVDEFKTQRFDLGKSTYEAIVDGSVSRLRPVMLVAVTTVLGMIPLLQDPFFSAMAVTIMFGLAFACFLTMIVVPVLYAIFFKVQEPSSDLVH